MSQQESSGQRYTTEAVVVRPAISLFTFDAVKEAEKIAWRWESKA